jgi:uncharacterized membrane protein
VRTRWGFERLMTFADAVVAIALTLLVLPLVEIVPDVPEEGARLGDVLAEHRGQIGAFLLSFVVIWVLWTAHHRTMENFAEYDGVIFRLTLLFIFSIVVLPFTTQLLSSDLYEHGAMPLYDGTLFFAAISLAGTAWWGRRHPDLLHTDQPEVQKWMREPSSPMTALILLAALLLSLVVPAVGSWPLITLVLSDRLDRLWARLRRRRG